MFKTVIENTPLVGEAANNFFENIYGDKYLNDVSFISTLRALVAPRIRDGESLSVKFGNSAFTAPDLGSVSIPKAVRAICEFFPSNDIGNIYIHNLRSSVQEDNYACLESLKSTFTRVYEGWHRLEKVTDFFRKQFYAICFINPEMKSVAIFVDNMDIRRMHYLQCSIFAFLPWYFNPEEGVSELEMVLINSLREKSATYYEDAINKIAEQYDFRTARIKHMLAGFETKYEKLEYARVTSQISDTINSIDRLNDEIGDYLKSKNDMEIKLLGLERRIADGASNSEIMEYFLCNDKLALFSVSETTMRFAVKSHLTYFDESMASSVIDNENSYIYYPNDRSCNQYIPSDSMKKLMKAIFIDQVLKIRFCAAYEFNLNGNVRAIQYFDFGCEFRDYMPNIHIDDYHCMGNYKRTINSLLKNRDYIGAIEQCVASSKSLNFGDSVVMKTFMLGLYGIGDYGNMNKCIELPNGMVAKPTEAIEWLEEQERDKNE